jgi:hypothetical protein
MLNSSPLRTSRRTRACSGSLLRPPPPEGTLEASNGSEGSDEGLLATTVAVDVGDGTASVVGWEHAASSAANTMAATGPRRIAVSTSPD